MIFATYPNVRAAVGQPCTLETYLRMVSDPRLLAQAKEIGACQDKEQRQRLKKQLPIITWQASFDGGRRSNATARPSGLYMNDYDDVAEVQALMEAALKRKEELGIVYIGRSIGGHGVRIVAECRPEFTTIAECQHWMSEQLGQPCDEACKDWARASYAVPASYEFYIDQGLFTREPRVVYDVAAKAAVVGERLAVSGERLAVKAADAAVKGYGLGVSEAAAPLQTEVRGLALRDIAEAWLEANGGMPEPGERNAQLFKLATRMRYITDFNPAVIAAAIPHCGLSDEEVFGLCRSACQAQRAVEMPWDLREAMEAAEAVVGERLAVSGERLAKAGAVVGERLANGAEGSQTPNSELLTPDSAALPPLPPVFRQFCDAAPDDFKSATVLCLLPVLGTLGSRLRARYLSGKMETPSFNVTLEAPQASGKSFIEKMSDRCLRQLKKKDDEGHALERIYQEEDKQAKLGTTKKERQDRKAALEERTVPIIRKMPATASITKLLIRMENAQGLHLFALAVEIDTVHKAFKRGFSNLSDLLRCAFDNSEYGQDYATDTSYSGNLPIYYNTLYSGTPKAIRRFYPDSEDGTLSRTLFVTLPDQFGKRMPVWRDMTEAEEAQVDAGLAKLYESSLVGDEVQPEHEMEMGFLNKRLDEWMETQRKQTLESGDRIRNTFYRRCAEVAFRAGMVAWYLHDEKQSPKAKSEVCKFALWVAEMMLHQFLMRVEPEEEDGSQFFACKVYNALPEEFSREMLQQKLKEYDMRSPAYSVLTAWKKLGRLPGDTPWGARTYKKSAR